MTKNPQFLHLLARIRRARFPLLLILLLGFGIGRHVISQIAAPDDALPAPWTARELDDTKATGYARVTGSTYELRQAGPNSTATKDTHQLLQRPWTNDAILTARLLSINAADPAAHAGIVLRAGLDPGDPALLLAITASNHIQFVRRTEPDAVTESDTYNAFPGSGVQVQKSIPGTPRVWVNTTNITDTSTNVPGNVNAASGTSLTLPAWLRLVRRGPDVAAFVSTDNTNWHWIGTERIQLPPQIQAGLAVRSADEQRPCVARFDQLTLQPLSLTNGPAPSPLAPAGSGKGLLGTYTDSSGTNIVQRLNATINFGWGRRNPAPGIAAQNFSGSWEGSIEAQHTGPCAFHLFHDDDARLWIGDALLIDDRGKESVREARAIVPLVAGVKYPVRLEYTQGHGPAVLKLLWSGPATPRAVIPQSQLHPPARLALPELARPPVIDLAAGLDALKATDQLPGLGAPWLSRAFGAQTNAGDAHNSDEKFELTARGSITGRGADEGRYVYQPWTGDVEIVAHIHEVLPAGVLPDGHQPGERDPDPDGPGNGGTNVTSAGQFPAQPSAKAGVMLRETLADDSPHAFVAVSHHGPTRFFQRSIAANQAQPFRPPTPAAPWVKLVRRGDSFAGYSSPDGRSWTWLGSVTIPMPEKIFVGLAAGSGNLRTADGPSSAAQKPDSDPDPNPSPNPNPNPNPIPDPDPAPDPRADTNALAPLYAVTFDNVQIKTPDPLDPIIGDGDGLSATYFGAGTNRVQTIDPTINFFWGTRAPADGIEAKNFSVRWEGLVEAQFSEPYRLHVINDSAIRLWFDGKPLLQGGNGPANRERSVRVDLRAGHRYPVRLEYTHLKGEAGARLLWSSVNTAKQLIPNSQLYSTANPAWTQLADKDHDAMPDNWEVRHGLDPLDAADAALDPDADFLNNLAEFNAGTDPRKADSDADGLPDGWETRHRLNPLAADDAKADRDHDGLSNAEEYAAGTDPTNDDTDHDGLTDGLEVKEIGTKPLTADTQGIETLQTIPGANAVKQLGRWATNGTALYSLDERGSVEYTVTAPQADIFRLELEGTSRTPNDRYTDFELLLYIDQEYLGRSTLSVAENRKGTLHAFTPWLNAGEHRVRIFWDNAIWNRSLQIDALRLQSLRGPDSNNDTIKDWGEKCLASRCTVDVAPSSSSVSPVCIEGRGRYLSMMTISGDVVAQRGTVDRWFGNVPLTPSKPTALICSFENDAVRVTNKVTWVPTNLLETNGPSVLTIRAGDALLFEAVPHQHVKGQGQIIIAGITNYLTQASETVTHRFPQAGTFEIIGTYASELGATQSRTVTVNVISVSLGPSIAAWVGKWRTWQCSLSDNVSLEPDSDLRLEPLRVLAPGQYEYGLMIDEVETRRLLVRLGTNGPVSAQISIVGFRLYSGYETAVRRLETFEDGSDVVGMNLVLSPKLLEVTVGMELHAGGVIFEEGTIAKTFNGGDFDDLGRISIRFIRPPTTKTSVCQRTQAHQGKILLGVYP